MARQKTYGFSFSWKRALGITSTKQKFAKRTGIPTSKQGMNRKIGASITGALLSLFGLK